MSKTAGPRDGLTFLRPRILIYSFLIFLVGNVMLWAMFSRSDMGVSILPDRNPLFVRLSDGGIRNGYTIKVSNKKEQVRRFQIEISGLEDLKTSVVGLEKEEFIFEVPPADVRALKVFVTLPSEAVKKLRTDSNPLRVTVQEVGAGAVSIRDTTFRSPHP